MDILNEEEDKKHISSNYYWRYVFRQVKFLFYHEAMMYFCVSV